MARPRKDRWDKLSASSGILAAILAAVIGAGATIAYNLRQQNIEADRNRRDTALVEARTVERFFPHLTSTSSPLQKAAVLTISTLDRDLATRLGAIFSIPALADLAVSGDTKTAVAATTEIAGLKGDAATIALDRTKGTPAIAIDAGFAMLTQYRVTLLSLSLPPPPDASTTLDERLRYLAEQQPQRIMITEGKSSDAGSGRHMLGDISTLDDKLLEWSIALTARSPEPTPYEVRVQLDQGEDVVAYREYRGTLTNAHQIIDAALLRVK